eukprot:1035920-Amphidinium_carterae.1
MVPPTLAQLLRSDPVPRVSSREENSAYQYTSKVFEQMKENNHWYTPFCPFFQYFGVYTDALGTLGF